MRIGVNMGVAFRNRRSMQVRWSRGPEGDARGDGVVGGMRGCDWQPFRLGKEGHLLKRNGVIKGVALRNVRSMQMRQRADVRVLGGVDGRRGCVQGQGLCNGKIFLLGHRLLFYWLLRNV